MKNLLTILLVLLASYTWAQEPVIDRDVEEDRESVEMDNEKSQLRWGAHVGPGENDSLSTIWSSASWNFSAVNYFRIAKFYSLGIHYGFQYDNFKMKKDSANLLSLGLEHDKQHLHLYTGRLGIANRIHLGKHGVKEGTYLEIGGGASIKLGSRLRIQNEVDPKLPSSLGGEETDVLIKKLKFTELIGYYGTVSLGRNNVALYGEYRFSSLFKKYETINGGIKLPELTPISAGIRIEF